MEYREHPKQMPPVNTRNTIFQTIFPRKAYPLIIQHPVYNPIVIEARTALYIRTGKAHRCGKTAHNGGKRLASADSIRAWIFLAIAFYKGVPPKGRYDSRGIQKTVK